jgi:NADP-dependent 3-hydroxy acid dehydrogenase YdfG
MATLFIAQDWNVIATMRHLKQETELAQLLSVQMVELDVTNPAQIKMTVQKVSMGQ